MKGIQRYFALALLLSVTVVPNAFSMEENLSSELQEAVDVSTVSDSATGITEVSSEGVQNIVEQVAECAEQSNSFLPVATKELSSDVTRYERLQECAGNAWASFTPRQWGQKFGTGVSTKLTFAKENLGAYAQQAKAFASSKKDAIAQYPYKVVAQGALEYAKGQAVANKPVLAGLGVAVAYETGLPSLAVKFAAKGVKSGAQKIYTAAKNHKKVATGLGAVAASGLAGLVRAAHSGAHYVQPILTSALENRSNIGKAAGAALVGVAAIEGARATYKMGKHYMARKAVLNRFKEEINNDCKAAANCSAKTSTFFQDSIRKEKTLFTEKEQETIKQFQNYFNALFNEARYLSDKIRSQALLNLKNASTQFFMNFGI